MRHLGFAVFDRGELISFGVRAFQGERNKGRLLSKIEVCVDRLVERHAPQTLAVEEVFYAQARMNGHLRRLVAQVKRRGRMRRLRVASYLPTAVKDRVCQDKPTRQTLAEAMVRRFWFLYAFLKPGRTRHYWQQMFDAVALGAVAIDDATPGRGGARNECGGSAFPSLCNPRKAVAAR